MLDARACLPILSVMVYWSWLTLYIADHQAIAFFSTISFFGLTLPAMLRLTRRACRSGPDGRAGLEPSEARVSDVSVDAVGRTMQALLTRERRIIVYHDRATGQDIAVTPSPPHPRLVCSLPWSSPAKRSGARRPAKASALDIVRDPQALLGYRLRADRRGPFFDGDARDDGGDRVRSPIPTAILAERFQCAVVRCR